MLPRAPIGTGGTFDGLSGSAILFGAFVDIAATLVASTLLVLWLAPELATHDEAAARQALAQLYASPTYVDANLVLGALCTVLGAFAGARRAGQLHVRHGGWIAVTSTALGVFLTLAEPAPAADANTVPLWAEVTAWLLILPAGIAGGALAAALPSPPHDHQDR
jgi:hypothetical protein